MVIDREESQESAMLISLRDTAFEHSYKNYVRFRSLKTDSEPETSKWMTTEMAIKSEDINKLFSEAIDKIDTTEEYNTFALWKIWDDGWKKGIKFALS